MRSKNLSVLDRTTLAELETILDRHTRDRVPPDQYSAFSWSVSRHSLFDRCKRAYYLNYYGARRVREANNPMVSAIWWLKQGRPLKMWIGSVIHHVAQQAVKAHSVGLPYTDDEVIDLALAYFQGGLTASRRGAKHENEWIVLLEDLYPDRFPPFDPDAVSHIVLDLARSFLESEAYALILSLPPEAILEIDEPFQSFNMVGVPQLDEVRIFAIPDVLLRIDDRITIIDWKTGDAERESIRDQAGVYRLYAHEKYGLPEDQIDVQIVDLANGGVSIQPPGGTPSVAEAREFITHSIAAMVERMDYPVYNTAAINAFPLTDDLSLCRECPFMRACWRHTEAYE
jgi:hypothetical protein